MNHDLYVFYLCIIVGRVRGKESLRIQEPVVAGPRLGRAAGPRGPYIFSNYEMKLNSGYISDTLQTQLLFNNQQTNISKSEIILIVDENCLNAFRDYVFARFTRDDARQRFNYFRKYYYIVFNPIRIKELTPGQARHFLRGLAAYRDFCRLYGIPFNVNISELRKLAPKSNVVKVLEYEESDDIINQALKELSKLPEEGIWKVLGLTAFFTGLRTTEIVFMIRKWEQLRKVLLNDVVIIELGYNRKSKKAWITMMPRQLYELINTLDRSKVGTYAFRDMLYKRGFRPSIMRKAHLAILSEKLMQHEIDLLQGRISSITVKHYTKHLREIAQKYIECFRKHLYLLNKF